MSRVSIQITARSTSRSSTPRIKMAETRPRVFLYIIYKMLSRRCDEIATARQQRLPVYGFAYREVNGNVKNLIGSRSFLSNGRARLSGEICQCVIKSSAWIFASVADGIKRPRDTNVIFIASQAPRYFRLAYAPSSVLSQKAFYRRRASRKQRTTGKGMENWSESFSFMPDILRPASASLARCECGVKKHAGEMRKGETGRG